MITEPSKGSSNKKNGKLSKSWLVILGVLIASAAAGGRSRIEMIPLVFIIAVAVLSGVVLTAFKKGSGKRSRSTEPMRRSQEHNHDRLNGSGVDNRYEHWVKQLDDFKAAGLIEKDEYNILLEKYIKELNNSIDSK